MSHVATIITVTILYMQKYYWFRYWIQHYYFESDCVHAFGTNPHNKSITYVNLDVPNGLFYLPNQTRVSAISSFMVAWTGFYDLLNHVHNNLTVTRRHATH